MKNTKHVQLNLDIKTTFGLWPKYSNRHLPTGVLEIRKTEWAASYMVFIAVFIARWSPNRGGLLHKVQLYETYRPLPSDRGTSLAKSTQKRIKK